MPHKRKTRDTWELWVSYHTPCGWEHNSTEYTEQGALDSIRKQRKIYPQFRWKIIKRREPVNFVPMAVWYPKLTRNNKE